MTTEAEQESRKTRDRALCNLQVAVLAALETNLPPPLRTAVINFYAALQFERGRYCGLKQALDTVAEDEK